MIELRRILLVDWYLFRCEQIDLAGMAALIGPNGAGKSAIIDAAQTVLTGANMTSIRFNASAQSQSKSKRSIRDYCLGVVSLDEKGEHSEPTRLNAYTYIILGFMDDAGNAINLGVAFSAGAARSDERCEARFIVRGGLIADHDLLEQVGADDVETRQWHALRSLLKQRGLDVTDDFGSASDFVAEGLHALSPPNFPLNPARFTKAFRNALLLKPVDNPTDFVRNYVLDVPSIHVDRLRQSITLYRDLSAKITNLKQQTASLSHIQRVVGRIIENERQVCLLDWKIARLRWEGFRRKVRRLQSDLKRLSHDAQLKQAEAASAVARVSTLEVDLAGVELTLKSSDGEQLALMYESECKTAMAERENALMPIKAVESLVGCVESLTERRVIAGRNDVLHGLLSAVTLAHKPLGLARWNKRLEGDWEKLAADLDAALAAVTTGDLDAIKKIADDSLFAAQQEVYETQKRIEQIDTNLKRLESGLSWIEPGTSALIDALKAAGIPAEPLSDLVTVKDPKWRLAAEAVLGKSRDALIVHPDHAVRALNIYRGGSEDAFRFAEVVNTTKTDKTRPAEKNSLATVVKTDNRYARAFLDFRIGRLMMVDSMETMVAAESAITPDRMLQSGRTVKRLAHPGPPKLGRGLDEETRKHFEEERKELLGRLAEKARHATGLKQECELIDGVVRGFNELRVQSIVCVAIGETLAAFDAKIAKLQDDVEQARRSRDPKLIEKQERLAGDLAASKRERSLAEKAWQDAHAAENRVAGNLETIIQDDHDRLQAERRVRARVLRNEPGAPSERSVFAPEITKIANERLEEEISGYASDLQWKTGDVRRRQQGELTSAVVKHCQNFSVSAPFTEDAGAEIIGNWAQTEKQRLEGHELVQYEEQCRVATGEMTTAFRDDLLHRLHDAFESIRETLQELNLHLKDRLFHGRDYYNFRSSYEPTHNDMIELVRASREQDFKLPLFDESAETEPDTAILRAVRHIKKILDDPQAKTDEIEDPRKYFNFELYIQDANGKVRSSLTSRAGTGSGGEGQLPFYIAIGASLAATYQNRRTKQFGLALAIFDEAFNRLDAKAICECSDFMRSLGLQIIVATPDEKRHVFMEVADTIVNINRSGNSVLVDTEYLTEKTRQALAAIDPYRKGFDAFKADMIAAETAAGGTQEAAE